MSSRDVVLHPASSVGACVIALALSAALWDLGGAAGAGTAVDMERQHWQQTSQMVQRHQQESQQFARRELPRSAPSPRR